MSKDLLSGLLIAFWFSVQNSLSASNWRGRLARKASPPGLTRCARLPLPVSPVRKASPLGPTRSVSAQG